MTWLLDLAVYLRGGLAARPGIVTVLQFQMLLPAFSAIVLGLFLFPQVALLLGGVQTVVLGPFIGLMLGFGEEYGWRGDLQNELMQLGRVRGGHLPWHRFRLHHEPRRFRRFSGPSDRILRPHVRQSFPVLAAAVDRERLGLGL